jgi:hypothetical protein
LARIFVPAILLRFDERPGGSVRCVILGLELTMIDFRRAASREDEEQISRMDAVCFPLDTPAVIAGARWLIGWDGDRPAAYCAWKDRRSRRHPGRLSLSRRRPSRVPRARPAAPDAAPA